MALRRRFFEDGPRRRMIDANVLDSDWLDEVAGQPDPYCFVSEAVIIYLDGSKVESFVGRLASRFSGALLITDTTSRQMVDSQHKHDAMKKLSKESWFRWACEDPGGLESWGLHLERTRTFLDAPDDVLMDLPLAYRLVMRWAPWVVRRMASGYRVNRFVVRAT